MYNGINTFASIDDKTTNPYIKYTQATIKECKPITSKCNTWALANRQYLFKSLCCESMREERRRMDVIKTLGLVIKEKRLQRKLTQDELANNIGMDRAHLSLLETGKKQPTLSTIFNVCDELGENVSEIFVEVERRLGR